MSGNLKILAVTAGLASKRSSFVVALEDLYDVKVLPGKKYPENIWDKIFRKLGLAESIGTHARNLRALNVAILERSGEFEILFMVKGNFVTAETLKVLRALSSPPRIIGWSPDDIFLSHNNSSILHAAAPLFDVFYTAKSLNILNAELREMGFKNPRFLRQGFDSSMHFPLKKRNSWYADKVTFIGFGERDRFEKINFLAKNGISVHVWGNGWTRAMRLKAHSNVTIHGHALLGKEYAEALSNSAINLCFLRKLNRDLHTSRSFEIPACGGFMIAERSSEHLEYFSEDEEAVYFDDDDELLKKVVYYLNESEHRLKISEAARERCLDSQYSYHQLARMIIEDVTY